MSDDEIETANLGPCVLELWIEGEETAEDQVKEEDVHKFYAKRVTSLHQDLTQMLHKYTDGHEGLSLAKTLQAIQMVLGHNLGLVEEWLRADIHEIGINPTTVDAAHHEMVQSGWEHAHTHLCEDEEPEEPKIVH